MKNNHTPNTGTLSASVRHRAARMHLIREDVYTMRKKAAVIGCLAVLLFAVLFSGCSRLPHEPIQRQDFLFDTIVTVTIYDKEDEGLLSQCMELGRRYENLFSRTKEGSDIWRINHANGQPVAVSEETVQLIETALSYCDLSNGGYDITIGAVSELWDFRAEEPSLPASGRMAEALKTVDYRGVKVDGGTVALAVPGAQLDLGSIAKGYIADRMADLLRGQGVQSAILDLGGNIYVLGGKPDGTEFRVGLQSPFDESQLGAVSVKDKSLVTSGVNQRGFTIDGKRYHHLLDPKTGYPIENGLASVTVVTDRSVDGDALSTVLFCLGEEQGMELAERLGIQAAFVRDDGQIVQTADMRLS